MFILKDRLMITINRAFKIMTILFVVDNFTTHSSQSMEAELIQDTTKYPSAAAADMTTLHSLRELCAKGLKNGVDWQRRPLRQISHLYKENADTEHQEKNGVKAIPNHLWREMILTLIQQGMLPISCTPLSQDMISRSADGSIGILISRHNRCKHRVTIIDDDGVIGFFTEKKPLDQAIISLDGRYVLTLKNKKVKETDKKRAYIKIWESQHQTCLGHHRFSEELQKIACVDDTDHVALKVDERTQYLTTIQSLLKKGRGVHPRNLDLDKFDRIRFISSSEAVKQDPKKFYDATDGVWNAKNPKKLFKNFIDLELSFEKEARQDNFSYFHTNPSGLFLAQGDSTGTINIWDIEKKEIVVTYKLDREEPIKRVAWRTHDKITMITPKSRYQFDLRDLMVGLFLEKTMSNTKDQKEIDH